MYILSRNTDCGIWDCKLLSLEWKCKANNYQKLGNWYVLFYVFNSRFSIFHRSVLEYATNTLELMLHVTNVILCVDVFTSSSPDSVRLAQNSLISLKYGWVMNRQFKTNFIHDRRSWWDGGESMSNQIVFGEGAFSFYFISL